RRVQPELLLVARHAHVVGVEDERAHAARARRVEVGAREGEERPGVAAVRDPLLRAGDAPAVVVRLGARAQRARVGARLRLGQRERAEVLATLVCTATVTPTPASARESSSSARMYETKSVPAPPYSSGTQAPMSPSSASFLNVSRGNRRSRSHSAAYGSISCRAKSRASALISFCSAVGSKSTADIVFAG